jgi:sugar fermentation stimulation protein A
MRYANIVKGRFLSRPNRFIAHVEIDGVDTVVHVKNTGRCKELLVPGCTVYLEKSTNHARKTPYDLVTVEKKVKRNGRIKPMLVNMDSQAPNKVAGEWIQAHEELFPKLSFVKPEYTFGKSRFDFYIEFGKHKMFIEVKGCTLEFDGHAYFPDAPTERGVKHLTELTEILRQKRCDDDGTPYECGILILIQMKGCHCFSPYDVAQPEFGEALRRARDAGVKVFVYDCKVTPRTLIADAPVAQKL